MTLTVTGPPDGRDADGTVRLGLDGTEDETGLSAGMRRIAGCTGGPWSCHSMGLVIQTCGPLAAGAGHRGRPECCQGPRLRQGAGQ